MALGLAIISVIGTGVQLIGGILSAASQSEASEANAQNKRAQAAELLDRQAINEQLMRDQGKATARMYASRAAYSKGEGAGIGGVLKIHSDVESNIMNSRRDAEFKAKMLRAGADIDSDLASDIYTAGVLTSVGGVMQGAGSAYSLYQKYSQPSADKVKGL